MMKKIIIIIFMMRIFNIGYSQNSINVQDLPTETIDVFDVCFNNLCIGDSISKMFQLLGKPDSVYDYKEDVFDSPGVFAKYRNYIFNIKMVPNGNEEFARGLYVNEFISVGDEETTVIGKVYMMYNYVPNITFGKKCKIKMGSDTNEIKKCYPKAFEKNLIFKKNSDSSYFSHREEVQARFERYKLSMNYKKDSIFRKKIDREILEFNNSPVYKKDKAFTVTIPIKTFAPYYVSSITFSYVLGKLTSVLLTNNQ